MYFERLCACTALAIFSGGSLISFAQENDIQKQLSNPIASLTTVPFQANFDFKVGPAQDGTRITTNIQPVIPFKLSDQMTPDDAGTKKKLCNVSPRPNCVPELGNTSVWLMTGTMVRTTIVRKVGRGPDRRRASAVRSVDDRHSRQSRLVLCGRT